LVLVEYHHTASGDNHLYRSNVEDIIKWATRCLYLEIFLFAGVSMFYLNFGPTFPFLGAILGMFYLHLIWANYGKQEREESESISALYGDMYSWFIS